MSRREPLSVGGNATRAGAVEPTGAFIDLLLPAPPRGGFRMAEYWIWCGSVIRGEDGRYHMFASRWPRELRFGPHWLTNSEVVRAVSDRPEGPFEFAEVVLPPREENYWDGRMTHNPSIHRVGDRYLLFYAGTTYEGATPTPDAQVRAGMPMVRQARANQRVGLATARSVNGPWERLDAPILEPRAGRWDALMTTNPAPCALPDGSVILVYKSTSDQQGLLRMGVARAESPEGPYERAKDGELFGFANPDDHVEDAYVWLGTERFELIMKDINGGISGEQGAGVHATSEDGKNWTVSRPAKAYSLTIAFASGSPRSFARAERPQLLIEDGVPRMLYLAVAERGQRSPIERTWNQAIPLEATEPSDA